MANIIGKKIGMTRIFTEDGIVVPVTVIEAAPIQAVAQRTKDKNGYEATQFKYSKNKKGKLKEFPGLTNVGEQIDLSVFKEGETVKVSGLSKAKGFQGAVKRHGFAGMPASHGHHHVMRHVGSIGQRFPQHTLKGLRMAGRMGGVNVTTRGLKIIKIDTENNTIAVRGAVPGRKGTWLTITTI